MLQVAEEHVIDRQGRKYILYAGLLDAAHQRGLREINTELIQAPAPENGDTAIVKAWVLLAPDDDLPLEFTGLGDANPKNVGKTIAPHLIRMAETRAKARALRDALNANGAVDETDVDLETGEIGVIPRDGGQPRDIARARKSQVDLLRTLAVEWRGEDGPERLETRIGKPLEDLTRAEAEEWIDKLTPESRV